MPKPTPTIQKIFTLPADLNDKFIALASSVDLSQTEFFRRMVKRLTPEDVLSMRHTNTSYPAEINLPVQESVAHEDFQSRVDEDSHIEETPQLPVSVEEQAQLEQSSATQDISSEDVEQELPAPLSNIPAPDPTLLDVISSDSLGEDI
jgi:hypothetical protein